MWLYSTTPRIEISQEAVCTTLRALELCNQWISELLSLQEDPALTFWVDTHAFRIVQRDIGGLNMVEAA